MKNEFNAVIEKDKDGLYVASVPRIRGCHTQENSLDELIERIKESLRLCLDEHGDSVEEYEFVGVQKVAV